MNEQKKPRGSKLKRFAGIAILAAAVLGYKFWQQSGTSNEVKAAVHSWVVDAEGYEKDPAYFDTLLDLAHESAFEANYRMGGRRRQTSFDDETYIESVFQRMQDQARVDGRDDVAASIAATYVLYQTMPAADEESGPEGDG